MLRALEKFDSSLPTDGDHKSHVKRLDPVFLDGKTWLQSRTQCHTLTSTSLIDLLAIANAGLLASTASTLVMWLLNPPGIRVLAKPLPKSGNRISRPLRSQNRELTIEVTNASC